MIDEGVLIAAAAIRMAVKNKGILRTLRDRSDYDGAWYDQRVRKELRRLAEEKAEDADRVTAEIGGARGRSGKGEHASDFRGIDVARLERRLLLLRGLDDRFRELAEDADYVHTLAVASRELASSEIADSVKATALRELGPVDRLSDDERATQLRILKDDLANLLP
ncbi:MAG: hypothetical protein ABI435_06940 [Pseudolysinimonas sp.]